MFKNGLKLSNRFDVSDDVYQQNVYLKPDHYT